MGVPTGFCRRSLSYLGLQQGMTKVIIINCKAELKRYHEGIYSKKTGAGQCSIVSSVCQVCPMAYLHIYVPSLLVNLI